MSFYIGRESSKVWFGLLFVLIFFCIIIFSLIDFSLAKRLFSLRCLWLIQIFFFFWFCEAMEETLRRDNNRAQPSCWELEVSSRGTRLSGLLFWFICFRTYLICKRRKRVLCSLWFWFWFWYDFILNVMFFFFWFWVLGWTTDWLELVNFPTLYENPMAFLARNLLKLELVKGYNHGWLLGFTLRKDLCFWQKIKFLPALTGGHAYIRFCPEYFTDS